MLVKITFVAQALSIFSALWIMENLLLLSEPKGSGIWLGEDLFPGFSSNKGSIKRLSIQVLGQNVMCQVGFIFSYIQLILHVVLEIWPVPLENLRWIKVLFQLLRWPSQIKCSSMKRQTSTFSLSWKDCTLYIQIGVLTCRFPIYHSLQAAIVYADCTV